MFRVCAERCDQCLFSKDKIVSDARRKEVLASCVKKDKHFICHKHSDVCCRGFFDAQLTTGPQLAKRFAAMGMDIIDWVKGDDKCDLKSTTTRPTKRGGGSLPRTARRSLTAAKATTESETRGEQSKRSGNSSARRKSA